MAGTALTPAQWRGRAAEHSERAVALLGREPSRGDRGNPVTSFLLTYYSLRPAVLRRWHPGIGTGLIDAGEHRSWRWYRTDDSTGDAITSVSAGDFLRDRRSTVDHYRGLLEATSTRAPRLDCFGLHEWAMVHRSDATRHEMPLRLGRAGTDAVVESMPLRCTHFDAYRFFTDSARPLNHWPLARTDQVTRDQPGCVHVTMDLYKAAYKLGPLVPGELLLDCLELARHARVVDVRASPYDVSGLGHEPIAIESTEGRAEYATHQRELAAAAVPLRQRLLAVLRATAATAEGC